jgi:hypothetical protein
MKQKDIKQIADEVIKEDTLQELSVSAQRKIGGVTGAAVTGAAVGGVVALYWAAYKALRSVTKKMDTETDIMKKAALKKVVDKQKVKVAKLKKKVKAVKEANDLTNDDLRMLFKESLTGAALKGMAKGAAAMGIGAGAAAGINYNTNKKIKKASKNAAIGTAGVGLAGVLAYKLYKKLKSKYDSATDPKEKAKLKKLVAKAKAKTKKK